MIRAAASRRYHWWGIHKFLEMLRYILVIKVFLSFSLITVRVGVSFYIFNPQHCFGVVVRKYLVRNRIQNIIVISHKKSGVLFDRLFPAVDADDNEMIILI